MLFDFDRSISLKKVGNKRAGKRKVWPGNGMKLTFRNGMEPASVFGVEKRVVKKREGEMKSGKAGQRNGNEGLLFPWGQPGL